MESNEEFEQIMSLKSINNINIDNNNIILLFDEINYGFKEIIKNNDTSSENNSEYDFVKVLSGETIKQKNKTTKLQVGTILSKLDGISNYNGLIIIATTNYIDKLEPAMYREMRLTPIEFKKLRTIDCVKIVMSYFETIDEKIINNIIKDRFITPAKLIWLCSTFNNKENNIFINDILTNAFKVP